MPFAMLVLWRAACGVIAMPPMPLPEASTVPSTAGRAATSSYRLLSVGIVSVLDGSKDIVDGVKKDPSYPSASFGIALDDTTVLD